MCRQKEGGKIFQESDSKIAEQNNVSMAETVTKYARIMKGAADSSVNSVIAEGLKASHLMYQKAAENNIPIIVDGELRSTYFSLHALTMAASLLFNSPNSDQTYVYGTFQCYLKVHLCTFTILTRLLGMVISFNCPFLVQCLPEAITDPLLLYCR